jgi:hypothetical protein
MPAKATEKPGRSERGKIQRVPGLTIDLNVVPRRVRAYTPYGVSLYAGWLLPRVLGWGKESHRKQSREQLTKRRDGAPTLANLVASLRDPRIRLAQTSTSRP